MELKQHETPEDPEPERTAVIKVAESIKTEAEAGQWRPGTKLPSVTRLMKERGLSRYFALKVISTLVYDGFAEKRQGKGTFMLPQQDKQVFTEGDIPKANYPVNTFTFPPLPGPQPLKNDIFRLDLDTRPSEGKLTNLLRKERNRMLVTRFPGNWLSAERELVELMLPYFAAQQGFTVPAAQCAVSVGEHTALVNVINAVYDGPDRKIFVPGTIRPGVFAALCNTCANIVKLENTSNENFLEVLLSECDPYEIGGIVIEPRCDYLGYSALPDADADGLLELAAKHRFPLIEIDYEHECGAPGRKPLFARNQANVVLIANLSRMAHALFDVKLVFGPRNLAEAVRTLSSSCSLYRELELRAVTRVVKSGLLKELAPAFQQQVRYNSLALYEAMKRFPADGLTLYPNCTNTAVLWYLPARTNMDVMHRLLEKMKVYIPYAQVMVLNGSRVKVLRLNACCLEKESPFERIARVLYLASQAAVKG